MGISHHFIEEVKKIIDDSRTNAIRSVDHVRVRMYWELGRKIVEEELNGKYSNRYKDYLIKNLSVKLISEYGAGFSTRRLHLYRQFFRTFPIVPALRAQLGWTHYKMLLSIDNQAKREFYEEEAAKNNWTSRQLERQINAHLLKDCWSVTNPVVCCLLRDLRKCQQILKRSLRTQWF